MKRLTLYVLFGILFIHLSLSAQDKANKFTVGKIGVHFSAGRNDPFYFQMVMDGTGYRNNGFLALGSNYIQNINQRLDLEIAIEYSEHNVIYVSDYDFSKYLDTSDKKVKFNILSIPVTARINFWKYFYFNGGLLFSFDISKKHRIDNQTGIGYIVGLGAKYDFNNGISVYINPYSKTHALIPFFLEKYHRRVWENGIRVGLTYDLGK